MALTNQIGAYERELELFERAVADPKGIRHFFKTENEAVVLRFRMHQARALHRADSRRVYPEDSPLYDKSPYDVIQCRVLPAVEGDGYWLYLERRGLDIDLDTIESLSEEAAE